ncbi:wax ester/triacylglycerol synthase family O-acyltransferase [Myxococcota bacterium]|nr:wax ester/triacylglycerol synthase family O-acyltransferase [Myxococcota bacterium]MCZ7619219.1 wax ester/triacylglycerol synthase family O-acyltransferase [Myxococcota bacterium]
MTPTDALFWFAEGALPAFRPIIAGLYVLDRAPEPGAARASLERALARVERLRQCVVDAPAGVGLPEWREDPHFDIAYHVRQLMLPPPGGQRELLDLAAVLLATPLDRQRPLWEAYWIGGLEEGRAAYFLKLHHSVVDGVGSIALLDAQTDPVGTRGAPPRRSRRTRPPPLPGLVGRSAALLGDQAEWLARIAWRIAGTPLTVARHPRRSADAAWRTARGIRGMVGDLVQPRIADPLAVAGSGLSRRLDVAEWPLDRLQRIKTPLEITLNDLVLASLAGALGAYHRERRVHADELACLVPMNLRGRSEREALGNRVGMFRIALPVGIRDPHQRLARIRAQTQAAKADRRGAAAPLFVEALAFVPAPAMRWIARRALGRVNVACTNVPGVAEPREMAGARIESIFPFASVVEGTPLVMALLSYAGRMEIGIDTDPEAIPDPHRITALFEAALAEYEGLATGA